MQRVHIPCGGADNRPRHARHVRLFRRRSGGVFRSRHAYLYGISEKRKAEARRAKEEIVRLQSVRLRFRGRRTAARLHLSDMQARRVGV